MASKYQAWIQEREDLRTEGNALLELEERTEEQTARLEAIGEQVKALNDQIAREELVREALRAAPAVLKSGRGDNEVKAALHYIRTGDGGGLQHQAAYNNTDMNIGTPADGGYTVPTGMYQGIIAKRDELALANRLGVRNIPGIGLTVNVPVDDEADVLFTVVTEASSINQDAPAINQKPMTLAKYAKYITLSWELLRDEDAQLLTFINDWVGRGVAGTENKALVTEALASGTAGLTLASPTAIAVTEPAVFVEKLAPEYQDSAWWLMHQTTKAAIQNAGDTSIRPFLPAAGMRDTLLDFPVAKSSYCSTIGASAKSLIFGNFFFMGRRQATMPTMLRDPYTAAATGQVRLWFYVDFVYGVLQAEAIQYATHPTG